MSDYKENSKVTHKEYGKGKIIKDINGDCRKDEVLVEFENSLPYLKQSAIAGYTGNVIKEKNMYHKIDIIRKKDLILH